jgi:hypothetical protein
MPHRCMTHDNSYPVATKAMNLGLTKIHDNRQIVMGTIFLNHPLHHNHRN